jgi:hypothetical protein
MSCTKGVSRHRLLNFKTTYIRSEQRRYRFQPAKLAKSSLEIQRFERQRIPAVEPF